MRRTTLGSQKPGRRNRSLPSNSMILTIALISTVTIVLSIIGSDYISPSSSVLDFSTSFRKRDSSPTYSITKSFWTSGSRIGDMAFALMPLVTLVALKTPPVAFLSYRVFTQLWSDKLAVLHRAIAWLVWVLTTAHVVLWTIELFRDQINGQTAWVALWGSYRFIFGCVAYGAFTAVMAFSIRPIRQTRYEVSPFPRIALTPVLLCFPCRSRHYHTCMLRIASPTIMVLDGCCCCSLGSRTSVPLCEIQPNQCFLWQEAACSHCCWAAVSRLHYRQYIRNAQLREITASAIHR